MDAEHCATMAAPMEEPKTFHQHGRFYEEEFPEVESTVVVQVLKIDEKIGAYVSLLEYDGREGMINLGELSKKRIRSMGKVLRVGSSEVCMVMSVDEDKGYINLSKKRVEPEDAPPRQELFAKAKTVHGVMQHVASVHNIDVEDLCQKVAWPLYKKYSSAHEAFKKHVTGEINIWDDIDWTKPGKDLSDLGGQLKDDIESHMRRRLETNVMKLQAKCQVECYEYDGIDAIKKAMMTGFQASKDNCQVTMKLIAHPMFALSCACRDKELGVNTLKEAMEFIRKDIEESKGTFAITSEPSVETKVAEKGDDSDEDDGKDAEYDDDETESEQDDTMGNLSKEAMAELEKAAAKDAEDDD